MYPFYIQFTVHTLLTRHMQLPSSEIAEPSAICIWSCSGSAKAEQRFLDTFIETFCLLSIYHASTTPDTGNTGLCFLTAWQLHVHKV